MSGTLTEAESELEHVRRNYRWRVSLTALFLTRALASFRQQGTLSTECLVSAVEESPVFPEEKLEIIRRGFERYVDADYISAIHVLVPHLEDCLRRLLGSFGVPTTSWREDKLREKSLDLVLESEEIRNVLGLVSPQIHTYFEHVLVEETGINLRNNVAHGLIQTEELSEHVANIVVHLYLLLGLLRAKPTEEV